MLYGQRMLTIASRVDAMNRLGRAMADQTRSRILLALLESPAYPAVLARELSGDVQVLIVANPCFGLDFASVAEIRAQIMDQRNNGAAVLLVSEDLDEILELADRIAVMSEGKITHIAPAAEADRNTIGKYMAGH